MFAQKKVTLPPGKHKIIILDEVRWTLYALKAPFVHLEYRLSDASNIAIRE